MTVESVARRGEDELRVADLLEVRLRRDSLLDDLHVLVVELRGLFQRLLTSGSIGFHGEVHIE